MVTSAVQGEGKSVVALNLAVAAARAGDRVVIVDADLRRPRISALLGQPDVQGLAHVLSDQVPLDDAVQGSGVDGLVVLPAGGIPPNPAELLSERNLERVLTRVAAGCDLVIVDSPPVLAVTDAVEMSLVVEAVVLVVDAGRTGRRELREAARRLDLVGANVAGVVINRSARSDAVYYGYGAEDEPARGKPRGRRRRGAR